MSIELNQQINRWLDKMGHDSSKNPKYRVPIYDIPGLGKCFLNECVDSPHNGRDDLDLGAIRHLVLENQDCLQEPVASILIDDYRDRIIVYLGSDKIPQLQSILMKGCELTNNTFNWIRENLHYEIQKRGGDLSQLVTVVGVGFHDKTELGNFPDFFTGKLGGCRGQNIKYEDDRYSPYSNDYMGLVAFEI